MKVLAFTWKSFCDLDLFEAFESMGHIVYKCEFNNKIKNLHSDKDAIAYIEKNIKCNAPDIVFSFNYYPVIAHACNHQNITYISWVYDNPAVLMYSYTLAFPTNRVFVFDSDTYYIFRNGGIKNIEFMPMAANVERLINMRDFSMFEKSKYCNNSDISFVGALYTEKHNFYDRMKDISDYTRGYLEGVIQAQMRMYGHNIVEDMLSDNILDDMRMSLGLEPDVEGIETTSWLYANYVVNRKITSIERRELLETISSKYRIDLYTYDEDALINGCINHGIIDYYDMAPYVYKKSKINLNISLRSIINGIPLRCFDIMGAGGFLITNYQGDFSQLFKIGIEYESFDSRENLMKKIEYYLNPNNESERKEIASNGLQAIKKAHTFKHRVEEMLTYV